MFTLIEIFDAKQYENILTPFSVENISKVIYVGSKEVMSSFKVSHLKRFFTTKNFIPTIEFLYVERDNSQSIINRFTQIVSQNKNCVLDATGGEDAILACVGIIAERYSVPVIRINTSTHKCVFVYGCADSIILKTPQFSIDDFITLQGGRILRYDTANRYTQDDADDIAALFEVNSQNCEAYSAFCNIISEYISDNGSMLKIPVDDFEKKISRSRFDMYGILSQLEASGLLLPQIRTKAMRNYIIKSRIVSLCLGKSGSVLEYYTAFSLQQISDKLTDIRIGVSIEWDNNRDYFETQNEIDVMAVTDGYPLFISCKNGEIKKDALYELDAVSRALGGSYAKRVLVCTYISKNISARDYFIRRARDMGIGIVFNSHMKKHADFLNYLKNETL